MSFLSAGFVSESSTKTDAVEPFTPIGVATTPAATPPARSCKHLRRCCDAARRRGHEFRADRIGDRLPQDPVDLRLGGRIEPPARHFVDRLKLTRVTGAPQRGGDTLVEHPTDRELNHALAEALLSEPIESLHGGKILSKTGREELRVGAAKIVAAENGIRPHASGKKASA